MVYILTTEYGLMALIYQFIFEIVISEYRYLLYFSASEQYFTGKALYKCATNK